MTIKTKFRCTDDKKRGRVPITFGSFPVFSRPIELPPKCSLGYLSEMNPQLFVEIDPRKLHLPSTRLVGTDAYKLHRQIARFGASVVDLPPQEVYRGSDGELVIYNGFTRATRVAILLPGRMITVEIVDDLPTLVGHLPT